MAVTIHSPAKLIAMSHHDMDQAIDLLAADTEDADNALHATILGQAAGFVVACNEISLRTARRLLEGSLSFHEADNVMNWVWSYVVEWLVSNEREAPEPMYSIYDAVDAGEYFHHGDPPGTDPVLKYTMTGLKSIVESLPPPT